MASEDLLDGLIDHIYDASLHPDRWGEVVAQVGATVGATSGTSLWFAQGGSELLQAHVWNIDPAALDEYQQHYLSFCPRYRASQGLSVGAVYDDRDERAAPSRTAREYYDFMDRYELGLARIVLAEKRPDLTIGMNFYNRAEDGLSSDGERMLARLAPHFWRACNRVQRLGDVADRAALAESWFAARTASLAALSSRVPDITSIRVASVVASSTRSEDPRPFNTSMDSTISTALPTADPIGVSIRVRSASVRSPARFPISTSDRESARASCSDFMKAPSPHFTSSTRAVEPSASFLLMIDDAMSGMLSTVAVTSRSA